MKYYVKIERFNMTPAAGCSIAAWYNSCERQKMQTVLKYQNLGVLIDWKVEMGYEEQSWGSKYSIDDLILLISCDDSVPNVDRVFEDLDSAKLYFNMYKTEDWRPNELEF